MDEYNSQMTGQSDIAFSLSNINYFEQYSANWEKKSPLWIPPHVWNNFEHENNILLEHKIEKNTKTEDLKWKNITMKPSIRHRTHSFDFLLVSFILPNTYRYIRNIKLGLPRQLMEEDYIPFTIFVNIRLFGYFMMHLDIHQILCSLLKKNMCYIDEYVYIPLFFSEKFDNNIFNISDFKCSQEIQIQIQMKNRKMNFRLISLKLDILEHGIPETYVMKQSNKFYHIINHGSNSSPILPNIWHFNRIDCIYLCEAILIYASCFDYNRNTKAKESIPLRVFSFEIKWKTLSQSRIFSQDQLVEVKHKNGKGTKAWIVPLSPETCSSKKIYQWLKNEKSENDHRYGIHFKNDTAIKINTQSPLYDKKCNWFFIAIPLFKEPTTTSGATALTN